MKRVVSWLVAWLLAGCAGTQSPDPAPSESYASPPTSILTPDAVSTRIGRLQFFDGLPSEQTAQTVYDHLDFLRGVRAFIQTVPAASMVAIRRGLYDAGALPNYTVLLTESTMDARSSFLTPSADAVYATAWLDLKGGPIVVETPPYVEGALHDFWGRRLTDIGRAGPDRGRGGMYVVVPPGYGGFVPRSEFAVRSPTYGVWAVFRGPLVDGRPGPAVGSFEKYLRIYPLQEASRPAPNPFVDISGKRLQTIAPRDASYFELIDELVQEEPAESQDPEILGLLASIGIDKGQRFAPDARMQAILADAVAVGDATVRALSFSPRDAEAYLPDRQWQTVFVGDRRSFLDEGARAIDARARFHYLAAIDTAALAPSEEGSGTAAVFAVRDGKGRLLDGSRRYALTLPPEVPVDDFWSLTVYDNETRSMLETARRVPSLSSARGAVQPNPDGSITIHFGPNPPRSRRERSNWIQTAPGKAWHAMLRLRKPQKSWFDGSWRPSDIELVAEGASSRSSRNRLPAAVQTLRAPDRTVTRIGPLELIGGVPTEETAKRAYDHLDFIRGVEVFLHALSGASAAAMRRGLHAAGVNGAGVFGIFDRKIDAHSLFLLGDPERVSALTWLDLREGAMIVELPNGASGALDDFFFRRTADMGEVAKEEANDSFLFVPPGYQGQLSEQYLIFKSRTFGNLLHMGNTSAVDDPGATASALREGIRIEPFDVPLLEDLDFDEPSDDEDATAVSPEPLEPESTMRFVALSGRSFGTVFANDLGFYRQVDELVQEEPIEALGPETLGLLASIGIRRGTSFAPNPRWTAILSEAATVANATARALAFRPRDPERFVAPGSAWIAPLFSGDYLRQGVRLLDARTAFFYVATPFEEPGVRWAMAARDDSGRPLNGAWSYRVTLPPDVPARAWSLVAYDPQTRSMLQTPHTSRPMVSSLSGSPARNEDGSITLHFGPEAPQSLEGNWIPTIPGKGWFLVLRLYGPTKAWPDQTWRPGEIEKVDSSSR